MVLFDRRPSRHLIDQLQRDGRAWLKPYLGFIADATHMPDGVADRDFPGRRIWFRQLLRPATMYVVTIKIFLDEDGIEIVTAYEA